MLFNDGHKKIGDAHKNMKEPEKLFKVVPYKILKIIRESGAKLKSTVWDKAKKKWRKIWDKENRWNVKQRRSVFQFFFHKFVYNLLPVEENFFDAGKRWLKSEFAEDSKDVLTQHFAGFNGNTEDCAHRTMTDLQAKLTKRTTFDPDVKVKGKKSLQEDPSDENLIEIFKAYLWCQVVFARQKIVGEENRKIVVDIDTENISLPSDDSSAQLTVELKELLQMLTQIQRDVVYLFVIEGFSHKEIAKVLEITEGYSRLILFQAMQVLRNHYQN